MFDWWERSRGFKDEIPNKFTIAVGELIRKARIEAKMSQAELAEAAYMRQAAISLLELGKRDITASEIVYLSNALNKPISYFYPKWRGRNIEEDSLSDFEKEMILVARNLDSTDRERLLIIARAFANNERNFENEETR